MRTLIRLALVSVLALGGVASALAAEPALGGAAAEDVVTIVTRDEDGGARETKIWIVDVDGTAYVRTGGTRWFHNIERNPDVTLKSGGKELALRAKPVEDEALRARIETAFAEKYGFTDRLRGWFVWGRSNLMELEGR
jgi:hypothetical protein